MGMMDFFTGGLGTVAGGLLDTAAGFLNRNYQESHGEQNAREQMNFAERMSSSAYQRAVGDMRAAGLNPMLAYSQGGASTPGGAMAASAKLEPTRFQEMGSQAASAASLRQDVEVKREQVNNLRADTGVKDATAAQIEAQTPGVGAQAEKLQLELQDMRTIREFERMPGDPDDVHSLPTPWARMLYNKLVSDVQSEGYRGQKAVSEAVSARLESLIKAWEEKIKSLGPVAESRAQAKFYDSNPAAGYAGIHGGAVMGPIMSTAQSIDRGMSNLEDWWKKLHVPDRGRGPRKELNKGDPGKSYGFGGFR